MQYKGVLTFHSETGTEGGYWAFQDENFIGLESADRVCDDCGRVWMEGRPEPDGNHAWKPLFPDGMWSYEGLHILESGDRLTVYDPADPALTVWEGVVELDTQDPYGSQSQDLHGLAIHSVPRGISLEQWGVFFRDEFPAQLTDQE